LQSHFIYYILACLRLIFILHLNSLVSTTIFWRGSVQCSSSIYIPQNIGVCFTLLSCAVRA
jgi:hypothetical protein